MARASSVFHHSATFFSIALAPGAVAFLLQQRQQRAQRFGAVADQVDFHRIAQADSMSGSMSICTPRAWPSFGRNSE